MKKTNRKFDYQVQNHGNTVNKAVVAFVSGMVIIVFVYVVCTGNSL
jgi:hypothetical protein